MSTDDCQNGVEHSGRRSRDAIYCSEGNTTMVGTQGAEKLFALFHSKNIRHYCRSAMNVLRTLMSSTRSFRGQSPIATIKIEMEVIPDFMDAKRSI